MEFFGLDSSIGTSSAFIQRRAKILPEAFECLFQHFTSKVDEDSRYRGLRLLAVDGSDLQISANPNDPDSYFPGANGQKAYNLLHINAMYDLLQCIYLDAILQKRRNWNESKALTDMVDRSNIEKVLLLADRGYESYNNLAHIQEKGWFFLIRIKDNTAGIASGLDLPDMMEYDIPFHLNLTRKQTNCTKQLCKDRNHYKFLPSNSHFDYLPLTSKAYQACADFYTFKEEYTQNMEAMMNNGTLPEDFFENDTYGKAMNAKASELAAQYGLNPEGESLNFRTTRNMCDALGVERFVKESEEISARVSGGSCYNTGNFYLYFDFDFPEERNYEVLSTSGYLRWNRTDCFSQDYVALVDTGDWIERNYTTASDSKVLILQSPSQETGYILCDRGDALMSLSLNVNIEILSEDHGVVTADYQHMTDRQIELVADAIDFAIQPRIPTQADVDAQAEIPQEATQNGYTLRLKSAETDGYVARILLGVTAPEDTVLPTGNIIFSNQWGDLTPASGSVSDSGGTIETIDDGDGRDNTVDLLLVTDCTMADGSAPFSAGTTWNLYLVDIVYSNWDAANSHLVNDVLAEGEWQFSITFDETNGDYREMELLASPMPLKACIGWSEDGTDALEAFTVTSFKLRKFSSSLQWDLIPDYHGTKDFGSSADFYGWSDQSGYHSACVIMKDGAKVDLPIRNEVVDLDRVDYVLLPDGTKLMMPEN